MDQAQRQKAVVDSLKAALSGLSEGELTEEKVRSMLHIGMDDKGLTMQHNPAVVEINTTFGNEYFIKMGPPSWIQYHPKVVGEND